MIQLEGTTSRDFHSAIADISSAISDCSGWVTNHQFYSNIMAMVAFELPANKLAYLIERLNQAKISTRDLQVLPASEPREIKGQINITFIHNKPDIIRTVPAFDL
jgi:hypothetical protein